MLFNGFILRRLTSLLRPWLTQEPQLQIKIGFFQSLIAAKNLIFDISALNNLIDDDVELKFLFKSVKIDEVIVRVCHWSSPAFNVEINGVNVTLFLQYVFFSSLVCSIEFFVICYYNYLLFSFD